MLTFIGYEEGSENDDKNNSSNATPKQQTKD